MLLLALGIAAPTRADYGSAVAAYEGGRYAAALKEFHGLAEHGDARAQLRLGLMYRDGKGAVRDPVTALAWLTKSAGQGQPDAQYIVGNMHLNGEGTVENEAEAIAWLRRAAVQGHQDAQAALDVIRRRPGIAPVAAAATIPSMDPPPGPAEEAAINRAAAHGMVVRYGSLSANNDAAPESKHPAKRKLPRPLIPTSLQDVMHPRVRLPIGPEVDVAEIAPPSSARPIAVDGDRTESKAVSNTDESAAEITLADLQSRAQRGDSAAQRLLARRYMSGDGVPRSVMQAARWYRKAAQSGDAEAQYVLSGLYLRGEGVSRDAGVAVQWLRRAAAQGHPAARAQVTQVDG